MITEEPQDQIVEEGNQAVFACRYTDSLILPVWFIGGNVYPIQSLPPRHSYFNQRLTVHNVQASDNDTTYICFFTMSVSSREAILIVISTSKSLPYL